ncbi:hypothetical protein H4S01_004219, partial [Coemansia sp. RSA 2610]
MESPVQWLNIEIPPVPQYPFGCLAEVSILRHMHSKLGPATQACVFLGMDGHKYVYMDIATRRCFLSHT